jgi:hypothetical protein
VRKIFCLISIAASIFAQSTASRPTFEVASVIRNLPF